MLEKVDGVIIKTKDYSETHKIITIFSKKIGKISALARGAKKPRSRMAALTQPFVYGQFFLYLSKGLSTIQQGEILDSYRPIREDIIKTTYAAYVAELTDKLLDNQTPEYYLYDQFIQTLDWISEKELPEIPIIMYELKLYKKAGFAPVVDKCVNCGLNELPYSFSIKEGGYLCNQCKMRLDPEAIQLSNAISKILYVFLNIDLNRVGNVSVKDENLKLLRNLLNEYYDHYGGFYLKSRKVLNQLDMFK